MILEFSQKMILFQVDIEVEASDSEDRNMQEVSAEYFNQYILLARLISKKLSHKAN